MENKDASKDKGEWIKRLIVKYFDSNDNANGNKANEKIFDAPIIGFANGGDLLFKDFKDDIGDFYLTPIEIFNLNYNDIIVKPDELTIISWIMPHIDETKIDNQKETKVPAERWARGKKYGIAFSIKLQKYLIQTLSEYGYMAISPCNPSHWSEQISVKYGHSSTWSERHAAYAAGLGTFGLCDGLITKVGKAMRCGSIIAKIDIEPTKRHYSSHTEYCLYYYNGSCEECIKRCPAGAITRNGHDKEKCRIYCEGICANNTKNKYNIDIETCGLCQTRVPCESKIPIKKYWDE
jgi:epoxyqueuosine reductase